MWKEAARQCINAVSAKEKAQQPNGGSTEFSPEKSA